MPSPSLSDTDASPELRDEARDPEQDFRLLVHLATLRSMAASVSHELRNTLNSTSLTLELFAQTVAEQRGTSLGDRQETYHRRLVDACEKFKGQMNALITAIRVAEGQEGRFDWSECLARQRPLFEAHATDRRCPIQATVLAHAVEVEADRDATSQAVLALVVWAIDAATPLNPAQPSGAKSPVALGLAAQPSSATLSIEVRCGDPANLVGDSEPDAFRVARSVARRHRGEFRTAADGDALRLELELPLTTPRT